LTAVGLGGETAGRRFGNAVLRIAAELALFASALAAAVIFSSGVSLATAMPPTGFCGVGGSTRWRWAAETCSRSSARTAAARCLFVSAVTAAAAAANAADDDDDVEDDDDDDDDAEADGTAGLSARG